MASLNTVINQLTEMRDKHGDLEVVLYDNGTRKSGEKEIEDFDVEFSTDDGDPVVILSF